MLERQEEPSIQHRDNFAIAPAVYEPCSDAVRRLDKQVTNGPNPWPSWYTKHEVYGFETPIDFDKFDFVLVDAVFIRVAQRAEWGWQSRRSISISKESLDEQMVR